MGATKLTKKVVLDEDDFDNHQHTANPTKDRKPSVIFKVPTNIWLH